MGWAEIGLGPRAEAKETERAGRGGGGSVVVSPERAKAHLKDALGEFWSHGIWLAVVVVVGFVAMLATGVSGAPLAIGALVAVAAAAVALRWLARVVHWARLSIER